MRFSGTLRLGKVFDISGCVLLIKKLLPLQGLCSTAFALVLSIGPAAQSTAATAAHTDAKKSGMQTRLVKGTQPNKSAKSRLAKTAKGAPRSIVFVPAQLSFGQVAGLHAIGDQLALKSSVALVVDQDTNEVLFSKNPSAVLPIASITKLMTALVVTEALLPLDEMLVVSKDDVDATAGSRSRLAVGTQLTRGDMLHLALMASENRAAHVLGRNYPGGLDKFVSAMNGKARELGMQATHYVEPTGLSSSNQSSAQDLTRLVRAAFQHPIIRSLSTSAETMVPVGHKSMQFRNTNGLVRNPDWEIGLQKTGYISAAGRCLVMQTQLAGRKLILVLLDSAGKYSRIGDAERIRKWMSEGGVLPSLTALPGMPGMSGMPNMPSLTALTSAQPR